MNKKYYYNLTYTVIYDANGGTGSMTDSNSPYIAGSIVTVLNNSFTKSNSSFLKWNTAADGSGIDYNPADTFIISADVTLYAQWINYSVNSFGGVDLSLSEVDGRLEFRKIEADTPTQSERRPGYSYPVSQSTFDQASLSAAVNGNGGIYRRTDGTYKLHIVIKVPNDTTLYRIIIHEIMGSVNPQTGTIEWNARHGGDFKKSEELSGLPASDPSEYIISHTFTGLNKDYMVTCEEV